MLKQALGLSLAALLVGCAPPPEKPMSGYGSVSPLPTPRAGNMMSPMPTNLPMVKIGLLVPLNNENAALGNALLDAATLALYDSYLSLPPEKMTSQIVLLPKDSGTAGSETALATKQAIDLGATVLLGPLFSQSVPVVTAQAKEKNIPVITFSNNRATASGNTLVFGFIPEQQIDRIIEYTVQHQIERIAVIAPNDAYGEKVKSTLMSAVGRNGGQVKNVELYSPSPANLDAAVTRLAQAYTTQPADKRYQALFIAEGGYQLKAILDSLKKHQLDPKAIKLIGTGQWDDDTLLRNPDLFGAWFASAPPEDSGNFEKRFMATYHYKPARIASLAYDAVTLTTRLALANNGVVTKEQLMNPKGYITPANGLFRFEPDGVANRKLAVMEIAPGGFKVLEPAPKSF